MDNELAIRTKSKEAVSAAVRLKTAGEIYLTLMLIISAVGIGFALFGPSAFDPVLTAVSLLTGISAWLVYAATGALSSYIALRAEVARSSSVTSE